MEYKYEDYEGRPMEELIKVLTEDGYSLKVEPQDDNFIGSITAYPKYKPQTFSNSVLEADVEDGIVTCVLSLIKEEEEENPFIFGSFDFILAI